MSRRPTIAIIGASGAVGREALTILEERKHQATAIRLFGSDRSAGSSITTDQSTYEIRQYQPSSVIGCDFALLCTDAQHSRTIAPELIDLGITVIDNSSAFRADPNVPLVIPEINAHLLKGTKDPRLIANPNCSTIMMLVALEPLRQALGVAGITVTTYQAVSGAGIAGIRELHAETDRARRGEKSTPSVFPVSCAFNVFPHESTTDPETGMNGEELKMIAETRRIWNNSALPILPTCVRVPVERAHSQSIVIELEKPTTIRHLKEVLSTAPGVALLDESRGILSPRRVAGTDDVHISRIRLDPQSQGRRFVLWVCCDQIRKGAALNAIQIMDYLCATDSDRASTSSKASTSTALDSTPIAR